MFIIAFHLPGYEDRKDHKHKKYGNCLYQAVRVCRRLIIMEKIDGHESAYNLAKGSVYPVQTQEYWGCKIYHAIWHHELYLVEIRGEHSTGGQAECAKRDEGEAWMNEVELRKLVHEPQEHKMHNCGHNKIASFFHAHSIKDEHW